jgi:uncharacterized repeat protein (TIGR03837 family)
MLDAKAAAALRWDIFCRVIDNFGDIGVCWRLSASLAARGQQVRLWVDDASALQWMAPGGCAGVQVRQWTDGSPLKAVDQPGDVVIEAFGCEIDHAWITHQSIANNDLNTRTLGQFDLKNSSPKPIWINLEYLSAEDFVQRSHGLPSPVMSGSAQGFTKWFFYPGFTAQTGGIIQDIAFAPAKISTQFSNAAVRISLFCYEPIALAGWLKQLQKLGRAVDLQVTEGRAWEVVQKVWFLDKNHAKSTSNNDSLLSISKHPSTTQVGFDSLLASCQLNFVRGEDSLTRALLAGRAFVWQIYPQADGAHAAKLEAFLDWLQAPADLREFHRIWNGLQTGDLPEIDLKIWTDCAQAARSRILAQRDLISQLIDFVEEKRISAI